MRRNILIVAGLAFLCGAILGMPFGMGLMAYLNEREKLNKQTWVLVARQKLDSGTYIMVPHNMFEWVEKPTRDVPPNCVQLLGYLHGRMLNRQLDEGAIVTFDLLKELYYGLPDPVD